MYTLRIPFRTAPSYHLPVGEVMQCRADDLDIRFFQDHSYHIVEVSGFESETSARDYFNNAHRALMSTLVKTRVPIQVERLWDKPKYETEDGEDVVYINYNHLSVFRSDSNVSYSRAFDATATVTNNSEEFFNRLCSCLQADSETLTIDFDKIETACELYSASYTELSQRSRLLTLVMGLESLVTRSPKHIHAQTLIDKWSAEVKIELSHLDSDSDAHFALESLQRELLFRKDESLRGTIRTFVGKILSDDEDAESLKRQVVKAYDARSTLSHEGSLDKSLTAESAHQSRIILQKVLNQILGEC